MTKLTTIDFHGAKLIALAGARPETTLVAMKPIVEGIGLDWTYQFRKINTHPVLAKGVAVTAIPSPGGKQDATCLSLDLLNFWLATIHPDRVKDGAVRARVIEYQTECARVLFNHFFGRAIAAGDHLTASQSGGITKAVVNKALAPIVAQIDALTARVEEVTASYDPTGGFVTDHRPMLSVIEQYKVPQKGRRGVSSHLSRRCERWLRAHGMGAMIRVSRETNRSLFKEDGLRQWLAAEGEQMLVATRDRLMGQTALPFPKGRRATPKTTSRTRTPELAS